MADISQVSSDDFKAQIKAGLAEARQRKQANRAKIGQAYDYLMGTPQNPQDHPANNVVHPSGNRGLSHATVPLNVPTSWPSSTGDYSDEINY